MTLLLAIYIAGGVLLSALSIPLILRRIPPNGLYGFRIPQTMEDPEIWYKVNAYSGKRLLVTGIGTVIASLILYFWPEISLDAFALGVMGVVFGLLAWALIQSFLYLRSLNM
jgi:uncharacterized membrane protein